MHLIQIQLEEKKRYLEHHWILAQKELDQEKALRAKHQGEMQKEYEETIKNEKTKYEKKVNDHEGRLEDLKKAHQLQCDELGREILKQKLEADRLFNELTSKGIKVSRRALFEDESKSSQNGSGIVTQLIKTCGIILISLVIAWSVHMDVFTKKGLCSPIVPGTTLTFDSTDGTFQAPWWAPPSYKEQAFASVCNDGNDSSAAPTLIEWKRDGNRHKFILTIDGKVKLKRNVVKAEVMSNTVRLWKRNGHAEEESFLW